jgi:catechol 2,3-dioxygenase-like lactoylglutathione lyase family enzyme
MHHVGLTVLDIDAACRWYADALGLVEEFAFEIGPIGLRGVVLRAPSGFGLELITRATARRGPVFAGPGDAALTTGHTHVALQVTGLDDVHTRLVHAGAIEWLPPQAAPQPGWRMSFLADPEGNLIELVESGPA